MDLATSHWLTWCWPRLMTPNKTIACFTKSNAFFIVKRNYFDGFGVMGNLEVPFIGTCYTKNHCQLKRPKMFVCCTFWRTYTNNTSNKTIHVYTTCVSYQFSYIPSTFSDQVSIQHNQFWHDTIRSLVIWKVNQTSHSSTISNWKHMGV